MDEVVLLDEVAVVSGEAVVAVVVGAVAVIRLSWLLVISRQKRNSGNWMMLRW